jgi:two-component system, LytTR family, sensor kinase
MNQQWYTKKWVAAGLHILFWALFFVSPFLLRPATSNINLPQLQKHYGGFVYLHLSNNLLRLLLFYGNAYLFIPRLVYKKKYTQYLLALVGALVFMLAWDRYFFRQFMPGLEHRFLNFFVFNLFPYFFIVISSTALKLIQDRIKESQRAKERETENLKTELSFLRSQVSPHFMFNVLNNMVALARKKSDALEPSLIKLSSLLRYMLYETDEAKVLVEKEVEYLRSYIDLQQQRFGRQVKITADFENIDAGYSIEPMLLIPFVENAFKHGTGLVADAEIIIHLALKKDHLIFSAKNKYLDTVNEVKDKTSGIGLNNVKRRLNLLYRNSHSLQINKQDGWFTALLQLNLH